MVPTDKYQRDGGICPLQGRLQVSLLTFSERGVWGEEENSLSQYEGRLDVLVRNQLMVTDVCMEKKQNNTDMDQKNQYLIINIDNNISPGQDISQTEKCM